MPGRGDPRPQLALLVVAGQFRVGLRLRADVRAGRGGPADVRPVAQTERGVARIGREESVFAGLGWLDRPTPPGSLRAASFASFYSAFGSCVIGCRSVAATFGFLLNG